MRAIVANRKLFLLLQLSLQFCKHVWTFALNAHSSLLLILLLFLVSLFASSCLMVAFSRVFVHLEINACRFVFVCMHFCLLESWLKRHYLLKYNANSNKNFISTHERAMKNINVELCVCRRVFSHLHTYLCAYICMCVRFLGFSSHCGGLRVLLQTAD